LTRRGEADLPVHPTGQRLALKVLKKYTQEFYDDLHAGSLQSARRVVPIIKKLIQPGSVIDVGCGLGVWLSVFGEEGIDDLLGVDAHRVDHSKLAIASENFKHWDLTKPLELDRSFDLVMCLEVAEHLPEASARPLIETLTRLGDIVLFSAAIPGQGGTEHINEQWPKYWADLFSEFGYRAIDCIRDQIWEDAKVDWWYAQNTILYVKEDAIARSDKLKSLLSEERRTPEALIHPKLGEKKLQWYVKTAYLSTTLNNLPGDIKTIVLLAAPELDIENTERVTILPFMEKNGQYWGLPEDDAQAIMEIERMREAGADGIAIPWSAFWVLEQYQEFAQHIRSNYRIVHSDDRLKIFLFPAVPVRNENKATPPPVGV